MRRALLRMALCALGLSVGCDAPDEIYQDPPSDYDPAVGSGQANVYDHFTGEKGFDDPTQSVMGSIPTVEVCSDSELSSKQMFMVNQPIIPMKGAGGLDMSGGEDWSGLTVDEAQSPDLLCQALYNDDGIAAWGDYFELIAFFNEQTRKIDDLLIRSGYKGTMTAGEYVFEVNEPIKKGGTPLSRGDGSARDPRTDDSLRAIDRALISQFRPELDANAIDCVEAGSCYIILSGTLPVMVFISVGFYVVLEPVEQRIVQLEVSLKRPFSIGTGRTEVQGLDPMVLGTNAAGIPDCEVTYGTTWGHIRENCLGGDTLAMAEFTSAYGYEYLLASMGGTLFYFKRPSLAADEILPLTPEPSDEDEVAILSINAAYEGDFSMPYSDILRVFKANLDAAIRAELGSSLLPEEPTGVEQLKTPDDPALPDDVQARYPDRLRPGGIFAAFCEEDGPDNGEEYDGCLQHSSGRVVLPLVRTLKELVAAALGNRLTVKLADLSFYVQHFERALGEYFNEGPIGDDQINYTPDSGRPDLIYATISLLREDDTYTVNVYYGGNDDRIHFINFQKGSSRMEDVLLQDARLPTRSDPSPSGVFTLEHLMGSPRLGLGAVGTVTVEREVPESRRALLKVKMGSMDEAQVLAPYLEASSVNGYWIPLEGPHDKFVPADVISLYGGTIGADFYLAPVSPTDPSREIVAIAGTGFFGEVSFCGFRTRIGAYADELLSQIEDAGYPCALIVRRSENRVFITRLTDMDSQVSVSVTNNLIDQVFTWVR